jgi:hypothetical protein
VGDEFSDIVPVFPCTFPEEKGRKGGLLVSVIPDEHDLEFSDKGWLFRCTIVV